ncbi:MAG TPA: hypothetical protein VKH40_14805 [Alloacidobacterium sp.]|nr:hypothetical protein [Alloacidobacterium sp.]
MIVNSDTVLALTITFQSFQPIRWRDAQVIQGNCSLKLIELPKRYLCDACPTPILTLREQLHRIGISKANDHTFKV